LSGNISGNITAPGSNTQIQFNDDGISNATSGLTFDKVTNALFTGGTFSAVGTATVGNLSTTGFANVGEFAASGNAVISGNLYVNGNLTYVNVTELAVQDPIISQGRGANNAPLTVNDGKDRGEQMWYYNGAEFSAFSGYDNSAGKFFIATDVTNSNEIITVNNYGNIVLGNIEGNGTISAISTITGGNLATAGNLSAGGNANVGNLGTTGVFATTLSASGNINGANVVASAGLFGATLSSTGTATVGNLETAGTISSTGTATVGNVSTGGTIDATANITGGNLVTSNAVFTPAVTNLTGNVAISANGTSNVMVVSSGGVAVTGNLSVSGNISGNFAGNISAAGSNTQVLFNDGGLVGANANFTFDKVTDTLQLANSRISVSTVAGGTGVITLAQFPVSGFTGAEFIVKGNITTGWSMATVQAVTDGTNVDYAVFGTLGLGIATLQGEGFDVAIVSSNIVLTANASASGTWVTQFRLV
jgi:hypothetical protein